eukprot:4138556-Amphidinium_carterae.1
MSQVEGRHGMFALRVLQIRGKGGLSRISGALPEVGLADLPVLQTLYLSMTRLTGTLPGKGLSRMAAM